MKNCNWVYVDGRKKRPTYYKINHANVLNLCEAAFYEEKGGSATKVIVPSIFVLSDIVDRKEETI